MLTLYKQQEQYFCIIITLALITEQNDFCTLSSATCIELKVKNVFKNVVLCCHFEAGTPCPLVVLNTKHKCNFIVFVPM